MEQGDSANDGSMTPTSSPISPWVGVKDEPSETQWVLVEGSLAKRAARPLQYRKPVDEGHPFEATSKKPASGIITSVTEITTRPATNAPRWWKNRGPSQSNTFGSILPPLVPVPVSSNLKYSLTTIHLPTDHHDTFRWHEAPWRATLTISVEWLEQQFPQEIPWRNNVASHCYEDSVASTSEYTNSMGANHVDFKRTLGVALVTEPEEKEVAIWDVSITVYTDSGEVGSLFTKSRDGVVRYITPETAVWLQGCVRGDQAAPEERSLFCFEPFRGDFFALQRDDIGKLMPWCSMKKLSLADQPILRRVVKENIYRHIVGVATDGRAARVGR